MNTSTLPTSSLPVPEKAGQGSTVARGVHLASAGLVVADLAAWQLQCISTAPMATDMLAMGAFLGLFHLLRKTWPTQRAH